MRENADNRLYGNLGHLRPVKDAHPGMQIAVGGCLAQKDRGEIVRRAPWVDVVFGTHNVGSLPALLERARHNAEAQVEILESLEVFPSTLPAQRDSAYSGWVSISVGCNNTCTFCIVPSLRGKEKDRRPGEILAEVQALVDQGVLEVTLLGQNVNSYGVEFGDRGAFARPAACGGRGSRAWSGCGSPARTRASSPTTSSHAMAETPAVCHAAAHAAAVRLRRRAAPDAPLYRRSATSGSSTGCGPRCRTPRSPPTSSSASPARPRPTSSRPSTSSAPARFASAFTFQYSKRPGTPAADMDGQLPKDVVQERYLRLTALQDEISWAENQAQVGRRVEVLVAAGEGRKDAATGPALRPRPRRPAGALHAPADGVRPGDVVETVVTDAKPHYLVADGALLSHRRTRAGDAAEAGITPSTPGILLGMPRIASAPPPPEPRRGPDRRAAEPAGVSGGRRSSSGLGQPLPAGGQVGLRPPRSRFAVAGGLGLGQLLLGLGDRGAHRGHHRVLRRGAGAAGVGGAATFCSTACIRSSSERIAPRGTWPIAS